MILIYRWSYWHMMYYNGVMFISFMHQLTYFVNFNVSQIQCFILYWIRLYMCIDCQWWIYYFNVPNAIFCLHNLVLSTNNIQISDHFLLFICIILFSFVTIFTFMHFYPKHLIRAYYTYIMYVLWLQIHNLLHC